MSRPSFRPRPIDLTKPLPIIKSSKDLRNEDDVVVNRALPTIATGVDPAEEEERHLQQALLASVFGDASRATADIPVPVVSRVSPPDMPGRPFSRPDASYIMFDRSDADLEEACIEYDGDHIDEAFVKKALSIRPKLAFDMDHLEKAMDAMEKIQGRSDTPLNLLPYSAMRSILQELLPDHPEASRKDIYTHWQTRRTETGTPFLRMYQASPDPNNQNPAIAFRPRDRDGAAGSARRMNTYDNFKRATVLREELLTLRAMLASVAERELLKAQQLSVSLLSQRLSVTSESGARLESVTRAIFPGDAEPVITYGPGASQVVVPVRGLSLPPSIPVSNRRLSLAAPERPTKKSRRRSTAKASDRSRSRDTLSDRPPGVDTFGYDEHGNRFLKHMRYFAGGFMNYGVSPYDHRVFSAASERNTVRDLPRSPRPVSFPGAQVHFGTKPDSRSLTAKLGTSVISATDVATDILGHSLQRRRRSIRTRARVGRGGRIILDRVLFERERGVKAASYPASVEMGGVYTAGLPLDASSRVSAVVASGGLGEVEKLCPSELGEDPIHVRAQPLIPPLKPVVQLAIGPNATDVTDYWPRRKRTGGKRGPRERVDEWKAIQLLSEEERRHLPAYAPRESPLVSEL